MQVVNKGANDVRDEIESAIYQAAVTILAGSGFSFGVPSRAKGNQLYVPELDRIVLKDSLSQRPFASSATCRKAVITARILGLVHELCLKGIHVTKRDLFYTDVKLFEAGRHAWRRWTWIMSTDSCAVPHLSWLVSRCPADCGLIGMPAGPKQLRRHAG